MGRRAPELITIAKINVRLRIRNIGRCRPPCRHIFNMINDIDRMDRQGRRSPPTSCIGPWDKRQNFRQLLSKRQQVVCMPARVGSAKANACWRKMPPLMYFFKLPNRVYFSCPNSGGPYSCEGCFSVLTGHALQALL